MRIVSIQKPKRGGERVVLRLDRGQEVELAEEVVVRAGMREGEGLTGAALDDALRQDQDWRAREASLRLLSHRPRTEFELRTRLVRKGFATEVVERCVSDLLEKGLLDDAAFAEMFARDRVRLNPHGRIRIVRELRAKGVDAETAGKTLEGVFAEEEVNELGLAREAARRWRPRAGEEPGRARRRLAGFLARRGFPADAVRLVVEEMLGEGDSFSS